ncbi:MAG: DUF547 domain-containing protein [Opitutaceae bacterium]|jgi:hypothetical protein
MKLSRFLSCCALLLGLVVLGASLANAAPTVEVPAGIDHAPWDALLKKYIDERGLVAYAKWKAEAADMKALDDYLARLAVPATTPAKGREEIAGLINAYNAFTIRWILPNYPTESIRKLDDSWGKARWTIGGHVVALDEIEHKNLRPLYGWRVHAIIVCAARSCPPLQTTAYTAENLWPLTEQAYHAWLSRDDLNRYDPKTGRVDISPIFKWFKDDFTGTGELSVVLAKFGPEKLGAFFQKADFKVDYMDYHWGLNDQGGLGKDYRHGLLGRFL